MGTVSGVFVNGVQVDEFVEKIEAEQKASEAREELRTTIYDLIKIKPKTIIRKNRDRTGRGKVTHLYVRKENKMGSTDGVVLEKIFKILHSEKEKGAMRLHHIQTAAGIENNSSVVYAMKRIVEIMPDCVKVDPDVYPKLYSLTEYGSNYSSGSALYQTYRMRVKATRKSAKSKKEVVKETRRAEDLANPIQQIQNIISKSLSSLLPKDIGVSVVFSGSVEVILSIKK